ncbi:MAG: ShlB/FhaC/HecB family hemolysin secretion/activation protein [Limnohabitans sp.]
MALLGCLVSSAWAQTPASDMDNWVQFPPRPRQAPAAAPAPTPVAAPTTAPAPAAAAPAPAPAPTAQPSAVPVVSTTNERDNWIRFPIRTAAPVAVEPAVTQRAEIPTPPLPREAAPAMAAGSSTETPASPYASPRLIGFRVHGNSRINDATVQAELRPLVGTSLTQESLQKATEKITALYQKHGMLAIAEMPAQDLTSGWAQIKIVEAKFAGTVMEDPQGQLANTTLPIKMVERVQAKGDVVSLKSLDQAAALMSEIPGVEAKISLRPGDKPGETQAVATILPGKPVEGTMAVDNAGARATGETRESAKVTLNNPLKMGDAASAQLLHSEGLDDQKYSYSVPVGDAGWRAGVNASTMQYKVVSPEFASLDAKGPSSTRGVDLTIPLLRENLDNVSLQLAYDQKKFKNEAINTVQSNYSGNALTAYLEANHNNGNGGETSASVQVVKGTIDLSNSTAAHQLNDASTTQTEGAYNKIRVALTHKEDLDTHNTVVVSGQSQWANKNLDGSERFYLGGMQGVRAYPTNEAGGSLGQMLSLEWQKHFSLNQNRWTAAGFYDTGRVTVNKNNDFTGAASPNQYSLSGAGVWLGTTVRHSYGVSTLRLIAAHRLGNNPGASANGNDQDGSRVLNRYRFSLNHAF